MNIEVRRARLADRPAIERFIVSAYEELAPFKGPDRWRWQFGENPYLPIEDDLLPVWIAIEGGDVVGQIAVQGLRLLLNGQEYSGGWIVDVMILPAYRGQGIGHLLHTAVTRDVPLLITLTMAPATRRLAERARAITLGPTWQFSRWRRLHSEDVRRYLTHRTIHRPSWNLLAHLACSCGFQGILAIVANGVAYANDRLHAHDLSADCDSVVQADKFGPEFDEFWQRTRLVYPAICVRDGRFLRWRFDRCPHLEYRKFVALRDGHVVGYSVLRRTLPQELRAGVIVDLLAENGDPLVYDALVRHAIDYFGREVASVECATSRPEIAEILRHCGFFRTRTLAPTLVAVDDALRNEALQLRNNWFFSKADHDWDQVHLA